MIEVEKVTYTSVPQDSSNTPEQEKERILLQCWTGSCFQERKKAKVMIAFLLILFVTYLYLPNNVTSLTRIIPGKNSSSIETFHEDDKIYDNPNHLKQIENYINGTALIYSTHITHHAGTFLCGAMSKLGPTPSSACHGGDNWPTNISITSKRFEWYLNPTSVMVEQLRPYFHFINSEHSRWAMLQNSIDFEYENLLSIIVMRHPIDRFLAGGKCGKFHQTIRGDPTGTPEDNIEWWEYANSDCADNYALRILAPEGDCCTEDDLSATKALLKRYTFIIDQDCLDESLEALEDKLNLTSPPDVDSFQHLHKVHASARERIGNETLWQFLNQKFQYDIALYEWSKKHSIVKCSAL